MNLPSHIVSTSGFIINEENKVLIVKHNKKGWVFPGGIVENGEIITNALIREVKEESGIEILVEKLITISSNLSEYPGYNGVELVKTKVMFDFICKPIGGFISNSEENSETTWVDNNIILDLIKAPEIIERYKAYINYKNQVTYLSYITFPDYKLVSKTNI